MEARTQLSKKKIELEKTLSLVRFWLGVLAPQHNELWRCRWKTQLSAMHSLLVGAPASAQCGFASWAVHARDFETGAWPRHSARALIQSAKSESCRPDGRCASATSRASRSSCPFATRGSRTPKPLPSQSSRRSRPLNTPVSLVPSCPPTFDVLFVREPCLVCACAALSVSLSLSLLSLLSHLSLSAGLFSLEVLRGGPGYIGRFALGV